MTERESMAYDVVIVGAGPSGLCASIRLAQLAQEAGQELTICLVEKGSEVGAHILSGAVIESRALDELIPDWKEKGAPLNTPVIRDELYLLKDEKAATKLPDFAVPKTMHNAPGHTTHGDANYIVSLGNVCRWLAEQAEELGVEIYPGFAAAEIVYNDDGSVAGVATGDMGVDAEGNPKDGMYTPGMNLLGKYTIFAEGCRGHLGKQLYSKFDLAKDADAQHYGIGIKELWDIDPAKHQEGLVLHGAGWPLTGSAKSGTGGGFFMYHTENNQVVVGLIVDLNYKNPWLSPYDEFQTLKHHPVLAQYLEGGKRVSYGARAITKGGFNALPKMHFPGGLITGCNAGTLNFAKIKGTHTAMKTGMLAAEEIFKALGEEAKSLEEGAETVGGKDLASYADTFKNSWVYEELYTTRNFGPAIHKYGTFIGGAFNFLDQNIFGGKLPVTLRDNHEDYAQMQTVDQATKIDYPKPDGVLSFAKLDSVFLSNTYHEEDQPCHLTLKDNSIPLSVNLPKYAEPAQRFCPAGVYEVVDGEDGQPKFQINGQNCVHCKTCDIKDPSQNITWVVPEGAGGPNYPNM